MLPVKNYFILSMVSKYVVLVIVGITTLSILVNLDLYERTNLYNNCSRKYPGVSVPKPELKYILIWTSETTDPLYNLGAGVISFVKRKCPFTNCHVSSREWLWDISDFDAVIFHGPELWNFYYVPDYQHPHQKYIFASMESAANYPICNNRFNGYFNWTWTYKLNSDLYYGYMIIRNKLGEVIGPREEMHWEDIKDMKPIDDNIKAILNGKKIAAAWFVSNCKTQSLREKVANTLINELASYNMTVDIYGKCGNKSCPRKNMSECLRMLERDYYFYFSFENSFSEDYVTDKLINALQHYTVPVVYGGANYTRFMPTGIYLDLQNTTIKRLAKQMVDIINDKEKYYSFFKWHNSYSYHDLSESPETDPYCKLCAMINNNNLMNEKSVHHNFKTWWNPNNTCVYKNSSRLWLGNYWVGG